MVVYVDGIVLICSNYYGILEIKQHLCHHVQTKDLKVAQSNNGIVISWKKYALDILEEIGLMKFKPLDTPMVPNVKLLPSQAEPLSNLERYRKLVGKLNYLIITPYISFTVSVVSLLLNSPCARQ